MRFIHKSSPFELDHLWEHQMLDDKRVFWSRWAVIVAAVGIAFTGSAVWYGNFFGSSQDSSVTVNQTQSTNGNGVNVMGDNNGTINTGN